MIVTFRRNISPFFTFIERDRTSHLNPGTNRINERPRNLGKIDVIDNLISEYTSCLLRKSRGIRGRPVRSRPIKVKKGGTYDLSYASIRDVLPPQR